MYEKLFESIKIGTMEVPNRIVMTAMGNHAANPDFTATELDAKFYGARAKGGVGLVITECLIVDELNGRGNNAQMSCDGDKYIPGLKKVADEVHKYGMKICGQIYHPGRQGIAVVNGVESMPSASQTECQCVHQPTHEMTQEEIDRVIGKFAQAARVLKDAGWDAVELHGAHGYMIGQFLSPYTNKRTDKYGGSFENRMRFLDEIIEAVRKEVGPDFPVLLRYSADEHMEYAGQPEDGLHTADGVEIGKYFESKVDALDVSAGIYETMNTAWEPVGFDQGWKIETPAAVKAAVKIPGAFHCHNNLGLSAANAVAAYETGADILDCGLMGMARSAGNLATEICVAIMQRYGEMKDIDLFGMLDFIDTRLQPAMAKHDYHNPVTPLDLTLGISGCHSSFLKIFKAVAKEEQVNLFKLICEVSAINQKNPNEALIREVAAKMK